ncbi:hypothetical protein J1605_015364 [Eschrichtius robustus]|uniref:Ras-related protein Rab-36 n=1 Tax=Eschrichtius robustus TaxID=9764 RepID=A0AB34GE01_ESCRO|nr:hypothetical protein J1605_015364 [Eschrichtius robustus]
MGPSSPPTVLLRPHPPEAPEASSGQAPLHATPGPGRTRAAPHPGFLGPWGGGAVSACPPCSRQWLEDALRENEPGACFLFLVGTKKDLLVGTCKRESESRGTRFLVLGARPIREACWRSDSPGTAGLTSGQVPRPGELGQQGRFSQSGAACEQAEAEAVRLANEMQAEYWSVSAKTGENVKAFFSRVAALAFEHSVLQDLERRSSARPQVGDGDIIRTCRDGGTPTRDPGQQEALQPRLLLAEPASEASTACMRVGSASSDLEGDMEHPPC